MFKVSFLTGIQLMKYTTELQQTTAANLNIR